MKVSITGRRRVPRPQDRGPAGAGRHARRPADHRPDAVRPRRAADAGRAAFPVTAIAGDLADLPGSAIPPGTDVVFHLAAVVSAQAEADYDLGRRVNLRGTDAVIDACRRLVAAGGKPPRVVFTTSVASFCGGQDAVLDDDARQMPANSYGAQKAAAELILADAIPPRLPRCGVDPPAHGDRPARPAEQRRQLLLLGDRPRAAARPAGRTAGVRTISPPGCAARAARWTGCCTPRRWTPRRWASTAASIRPASAPRSRICCRRWTR